MKQTCFFWLQANQVHLKTREEEVMKQSSRAWEETIVQVWFLPSWMFLGWYYLIQTDFVLLAWEVLR